MYAISTPLFLVAGKASRIPKVTYYFSSIVARCAKCKSPLHGPRNYVDRTCEPSANYSAHTFWVYLGVRTCELFLCFVVRLGLLCWLLCFLCFTSLVSFTGSYTEVEPTFSCYRAKPKCNFAVRPLYDRSTMLGRLLQTVWVCFLEKKRKRNIVWEFAKMFETMVGVELLEGYKRAVCDTCRYSILW